MIDGMHSAYSRTAAGDTGLFVGVCPGTVDTAGTFGLFKYSGDAISEAIDRVEATNMMLKYQAGALLQNS